MVNRHKYELWKQLESDNMFAIRYKPLQSRFQRCPAAVMERRYTMILLVITLILTLEMVFLQAKDICKFSQYILY